MRVLQQCLLSPSSSVPGSALPLTFLDIVWLPTPSVEYLYLYEFPHPTCVFMESYLPGLKSSLSHTLHRFYPLAGRLRLSPPDQYEILCADGDAVPFTVVETTGDHDIDFLDIVGSHPRQSFKIQPLVPHLPPVEMELAADNNNNNSTPLLAVQVTVFPNRGIGIGYSLHHFACDGFSTVHFMDSWAASCRSSNAPPPPPSFNRSLIVDPCNLYSEFLGDVLSLRNNRPIVPLSAESYSDAVIASFTLGSEQVERLKALAGSNCSKFVVSSAYVWVCLAKMGVWSAAAAAADRNNSNNIAHYVFVVDWRRRLGVPDLEWYFGNCLGVCFAEAKVSDLVKLPPKHGMVAACGAIGSAIEELKEGFTKNVVGSTKRVHSVLACQPLTVAGSPNYRVYDMDFGWGRPMRVDMVSITRTMKTGAVSMWESRDERGGVEIGIALPKDGMETFMLHFEEGLKSDDQ